MSTRATKEAMDLLAKYIEDSGPCEHAANICMCGEKQVVDDARAEVEAIERAAKDMTRLYAGDLADHIRSRGNVLSETPDGHSTWEHPDVKAWSDASGLLKRIAKGAK